MIEQLPMDEGRCWGDGGSEGRDWILYSYQPQWIFHMTHEALEKRERVDTDGAGGTGGDGDDGGDWDKD